MIDSLAQFFLAGGIADLVLIVMVIEAFALSWYSGQRVGAPKIKIILFALLPGAFLALALKAALMQVSWLWIAAALLCSLVTHFLDMRGRFQRRAPSSKTR
jgi:hypothetical protein